MRSAAAGFLVVLVAGCVCGGDDEAPPSPCPQGCARGETCVAGRCLPPVPCEILTCLPSDDCDNGLCVPADLCAEVTCAEGQACQKGVCVPADDDRDRDGFTADEDCDDADPGAHRGAQESCNAADDDCDGVADEAGCEPGQYCCAAAGWGCTTVESDVDNCGRCGNRCTEGEACCDGLCVDPLRDVDHCGGCDRPCSSDGCLGSICDQGVCVGEPDLCDDRLQCTTDRCDPARGSCQHFPDTTRCGAQQECSADEGCVSSPGCGDGCADGYACTEDRCDATLGRCLHEPLDARCDDGDLCTTDLCAVGYGCLHDPVECEDGDPCTIDRCDPVLGCLAEPPVEDCTNGVDDDCDGLVDCGQDPDCDGLSRPVSSGAFDCVCQSGPLGACGPEQPCGACVIGPEGARVCLKVDGGWEWTEPADPSQLFGCDRACSVRCACRSSEMFRCDGEHWVRVLEGDDRCRIGDEDRCDR